MCNCFLNHNMQKRMKYYSIYMPQIKPEKHTILWIFLYFQIMRSRKINDLISKSAMPGSPEKNPNLSISIFELGTQHQMLCLRPFTFSKPCFLPPIIYPPTCRPVNCTLCINLVLAPNQSRKSVRIVLQGLCLDQHSSYSRAI